MNDYYKFYEEDLWWAIEQREYEEEQSRLDEMYGPAGVPITGCEDEQ